MWHTVFIKNEDFILYESEKVVKIKIPLKGAHYIWLPKKQLSGLQELFKDKDFSKSWE